RLRDRGYLDAAGSTEVVHNGAPILEGRERLVNNMTLLCIARLDHHKGIDVLIRAVSLLPAPRPHLELIGTGCEEASLREYARTLNVEDRVVFRGFQDRVAVA